MRLASLFKDWMAGLARDQRGSTFVMLAIGFTVVIAAIGSAIDIGRMYIVKSQLQSGVDAAALAGARAFGVTDSSANGREAQVDAYFDGNFPRTPAYMGTTNINVRRTFATTNGYNVTTVNASATLPMSFMKIFGFQNTTLSAVARAELQPRPLEVMMVLDNTGSMRFNLSNGRTRMTALKEAANDFIDILHQGSSQRRDLALGVVPYDITANVGNLLTAWRSSSVATLTGFNSTEVTRYGTWPGNPYHWKGCVMNDATVRDVSTDRLTSEVGAWDLGRDLPGEGAHPAVQPFFFPPVYVPALGAGSVTNAQRANPNGDFYKLNGGEAANNLYRFDKTLAGAGVANDIVNTAAYRSWFYDYYIGLNNGSGTAGDDVIRSTVTGAYYNPNTGNRATVNWYVDWTRLPNLNTWGFYANQPSTSEVNPSGGAVDDYNQNQTDGRSPNWQCPEEAMPLRYNRPKSDYSNYIRDKNGAIYPGNGTIHQAGLLWGYRLLVRDDIFQRPRPAGMTTEPARRAIVFMTDGVNDVGENINGYTDRTFTWYGRWSDATISANANDAEEQMLRRFEKTCANIQRDTSNGTRPAPEVYIIALVANSSRIEDAFDQCAPGRVYRTSNTTELRRAFQNVASELIDLHLVQ